MAIVLAVWLRGPCAEVCVMAGASGPPCARMRSSCGRCEVAVQRPAGVARTGPVGERAGALAKTGARASVAWRVSSAEAHGR